MAAPPRPPYEPITTVDDQETRENREMLDAMFMSSFTHPQPRPFNMQPYGSTTTVNTMSPEITQAPAAYPSNRFSFRRIASAMSLRSPSPGPRTAPQLPEIDADPMMFAQIRERLRQLEFERDELRIAAQRERQRAWEMQRHAEEERAIAERIKRESAAGPSGAEIELRLLQLKYDALLAGADAKPRVTDGLFKSVCSTDLLFLMDTTGSMGSYIEAAKTQVRNIMDDITEAFFEEATVRIAVVGYKDHKDKPNVQFLDFTPDVDRVRSFLDELKATGGDDEPEDVLGGINQALNATWQQQTRCIIHIADAPPHGRNLHDTLRNGAGKGAGRDDYEEPGTEPHKLTFEPLMKRMVGLNINYALLRINNSTDRMAFEFLKAYANNAASSHCKLLKQNAYSSQAKTAISNLSRSSSKRSAARAGLQFEEVALGTTYNALRHLVVRSVTTSASRTAVRAMDRDHKLDLELDAIKEDEDMDEFSEKPLKTAADVDKKWDTTHTGNADTLVRSSDGSADTVAKYKSRNSKKMTVETDSSPPKWDTEGWLDETIVAEAFSTNLTTVSRTTGSSSLTAVAAKSPLEEMLSSPSSTNMISGISTTELTIHRRSQPFAQGAMRVAAYARTANSTNKLVVKTFKKGGKRLAHLVEDMYCQALCKAFALEFNTLLGNDTRHSLDFIMVTCLKPKNSSWASGNPADNIECLTLEPYIEGSYIKYNSNSGYVNDLSDFADGSSALLVTEATNNAAQAFSHFTFERSKGQYLISDLQGVGRMLTDPAIHTKDPERFKLADTNLGEAGFKFFFATHVCNDVCKKLGLKSTARMIINGNFEFREDWTSNLTKTVGSISTVCCSNKLCSRIVRIPAGTPPAAAAPATPAAGTSGSTSTSTATVKPVTSEKFPGYFWCEICLPQLESSKMKFICVARNGPHHEFEVSRFFYESQGRGVPRVCPGHELDEDYVPQKGETTLFGRGEEEEEGGKDDGKKVEEKSGVGAVLRRVFCLPGSKEKEAPAPAKK